MTVANERFLVNEAGERIAVLIDLVEYERLLEALEELESIRAYDSAKAIQDDEAHFAFGDLDKETIERKWHEAHRRFYLRPSRIVRIVTRGDTWKRFPYYLRTAGSMLLGLGEREAA